YIYYYNGGGVATGDINNDGLVDIYFTANTKGGNKLYLNKGNFQFEDITEKAGVAGTADWCSGVTMADVNGDGWLDIYVSAVSGVHGLTGHNQLFINNGSSSPSPASLERGPGGEVSFTESAAAYSLDFSGLSTQAAFFDYDHDGDLDCYLLNHSQKPHANIVDTSNRRKFDPLAGDHLYRNELNTGIKKFTDVSAAAGIYQSSLGYGLGISVADLNNDGWEDIYIGNDFHENDYYYVNNGNGTFSESGAKHFNHYSRFSMGNDIADYNNDGQLDIITADMLPSDEKVLKTYGSDENPDIYSLKLIRNGFQYQYSKNCLQRNNGNGNSFSETALLSGVAATDWSWAPLFADFDNDANKDLFISSGIVKRPVDMDFVQYVSNLYLQASQQGTNKYDKMALEKMPGGPSHPYLFKGDGDLIFKDVSAGWGTGDLNGFFNGASYADLDNDGNLDLIINAINAPAVILKNRAPKRSFISLSFRSDSGNTFGIGCKAYLFQKGKMQYQQLMLTRGFQSSTDTRLHFGLDSATTVDSILLVWPDATYQVLKNIPANQQLQIKKKNAGGVFPYQTYFQNQPTWFTDKTESISLQWKHRENAFNDFNRQYLIPHAQSTRGPKIAVADVNGDGLDDFYACGAKGQPGTLMLQQKSGAFMPIDTALFNTDAGCEDIDAVFFDANGDNHPDLYVVSGGNEYTGNHPFLLDRLYINDGEGHFVKSINALPALYQNKSCVSVADIDRDGDNDLFIGTLADATAYGVPQTSFLLLNNGKGAFTQANESIIPLTNMGIVTSAVFADINKDGWKDLIVTGEWMPVTIFINRSGRFEKTILPNSTGLWQTVFADDVNNDGNIDLLIGNWGWNNKFWCGKDGPLRMYVADFDNNGKTEQLLSYTVNGTEYPFLAKDEVERPMPLLKKHYLLYAEYAGVPMKDVFYGWIDNVKPFTAERLGSAVCFGDGKGAFTIQDLPARLQLAPIFSFQKMSTAGKENIYVAGGNFFDVTPYEGRYDAQALALFKIDNNQQVRSILQPDLAAIRGQVRDLKWLRTATSGSVLAVARNNESLLFFGNTVQAYAVR
ncbi:MAG: VCBS repeat-containing protein, partial [Flavisolibacter sp.]|nr:VCBS repeat-containing protein [Flavisolibacter sp.]